MLVSLLFKEGKAPMLPKSARFVKEFSGIVEGNIWKIFLVDNDDFWDNFYEESIGKDVTYCTGKSQNELVAASHHVEALEMGLQNFHGNPDTRPS